MAFRAPRPRQGDKALLVRPSRDNTVLERLASKAPAGRARDRAGKGFGASRTRISDPARPLTGRNAGPGAPRSSCLAGSSSVPRGRPAEPPVPSCALTAPRCASRPEQGGRDGPGRTGRRRSVQSVVERGTWGHGRAPATGSRGTGQVFGLGARAPLRMWGWARLRWGWGRPGRGPEARPGSGGRSGAGRGGAMPEKGSCALWEAGKRVLDRTCLRVGEGAVVLGLGATEQSGDAPTLEQGWVGGDVAVLLGVRNQGGSLRVLESGDWRHGRTPACRRQGAGGGVCWTEGARGSSRGKRLFWGPGAGAAWGGGGTRDQGSATYAVGDGD